MCEKVFCEVCGELGYGEKRVEAFRVILCSNHHNELHLKLHKGDARTALRSMHITRRTFQIEGCEEQFENWINAEDRVLEITATIVKKMKKNPPPEPKPLD